MAMGDRGPVMSKSCARCYSAMHLGRWTFESWVTAALCGCPVCKMGFQSTNPKKRWSIRCGLVGDVQIFSRIIQAQWECQHRAISHINHGKRRENPAARCLESQLPAEVKTYYEENRNRCRDLGVDQQPAFPFQIDLEDLKNGRWIVFFWHKHAWTWSRWSFIQLSQVSWLHSISCYWI